METLLNKLADIFGDNTLPKATSDELTLFLDALEQGHVRCAHKNAHGVWTVDERVKKGILLCFRAGVNERVQVGPLTFIDKHNLWPRSFDVASTVRLVPGGVSVRRGAHLGQRVTLMPPSFVNIGAFVDDDSMVDSHALVGSCAMVGKGVHISAGAQIGGVLEPAGSLPVIIEDGVMLGGQVGVFEGVIVGAGAILGAGVVLTASSKVYDLVNGNIIEGASGQPLTIPNGAVVVPGSRAVSGDFAKEHQLSIATPLIVKYRDDQTAGKTKLEKDLR
jgi:2,3,4,5-tetrahydropyridine-2-carboxylate N-succinyltransferase